MILTDLFEAVGKDSTAQRVVEVLRQVHPDPSEATEREILAATSRVLSDQGMSDVSVRFYLRDPDFQSDIIEAVQAQLQGVAEVSGNNDNNDFYSGLYAELLGDVNNYSVTDMVNTKNSIKRALESGRLSLADVKSEIHQLESELKKQGVSEAMKPSDIPPSMRQRLTMRDIERERPEGAYRFRVTFPDGHQTDYMTFDAAHQAAEQEKGRISKLS